MRLLKARRNWVGKTTGILVCQRLTGGSSRLGFHYNLFNAADEKIPLSVGHVNKKPQHLVFCLYSPHLPSK
jgi:hypothetical protein